MSDKVKLDVACELLRKAISDTMSCQANEKRWVELAKVSTQKKKLLGIQNSKARFQNVLFFMRLLPQGVVYAQM